MDSANSSFNNSATRVSNNDAWCGLGVYISGIKIDFQDTTWSEFGLNASFVAYFCILVTFGQFVNRLTECLHSSNVLPSQFPVTWHPILFKANSQKMKKASIQGHTLFEERVFYSHSNCFAVEYVTLLFPTYNQPWFHQLFSRLQVFQLVTKNIWINQLTIHVDDS